MKSGRSESKESGRNATETEARVYLSKTTAVVTGHCFNQEFEPTDG